MQQIAVRGVDLDQLRAGGGGTTCCLRKAAYHPANFSRINFLWDNLIKSEWFRRRSKDRAPPSLTLSDRASTEPWWCGARFPAGVRELNRGDSSMFLDETEDAREHLDMFIFPQTEILWTDPAFRDHGRCLSHDECGAADRAASEMNEVPIIREAIRARVLTHRRNADAISQFNTAEP